MKGKIFGISLMSLFACNACFADVLDLTTALQNTYRACVDIDENLHELKVLAGVNTGVTAVGTGLGIGATATGLAKASVDAEIEKLIDEMYETMAAARNGETSHPMVSKENVLDWLKAFDEKNHFDVAKYMNQDLKTKITTTRSDVEKLEEKSKNLGNWRTGLLAGNTVTNVAGAIIASKTINKDDINSQIEACISATKDLNNAINAARMNGEDITEAKQIYDACRDYAYVDMSPIDKRGKGSMISSSVGAGLGGIGTITSGVANSDKIRSNDSAEGKEKEKKLNTASNLLSAGATVASATATVFNATQISAIKKVAEVSQKCTEVLK